MVFWFLPRSSQQLVFIKCNFSTQYDRNLLLFYFLMGHLAEVDFHRVKYSPVIVPNSSKTRSENTIFLLLPTLRKSWQADEGWWGGEAVWILNLAFITLYPTRDWWVRYEAAFIDRQVSEGIWRWAQEKRARRFDLRKVQLVSKQGGSGEQSRSEGGRGLTYVVANEAPSVRIWFNSEP